MYVGEARLYQQQVSGDTIVSAAWAASPSPGLTIGTPVNTGTSSTVLVTAVTGGTYTLQAALTLASGQILFGLVSISVATDPV